jgi:hypothetical protein
MEMNDFAKNFLAGNAVKLSFTQQEVDIEVEAVRSEIMAMAIEAAKMAVQLEREACAKMADECVNIEELGEAIRNRTKAK